MTFGRLLTFLKNPITFSTILTGFASLTLLTALAWSAPLGSLRLSYLYGDVQVRTGDTQDWVAAAINIPLADGDNVWVPEGATAEIQTLKGTCLRIDANTSLSVVAIGKNTYQFSLDQGNAYINPRGGKNDLFQLDTPSASVRVIGKSIFEVDVSTDGYADVSVLAGSISVESESGGITVSQGQMVSIRQGGTSQLLALPPPDEWTRWNRDRDRVIYQHRASARYLPGDLQSYSSDFDQNGQWTNAPDYGYVWTPTAIVGASWSPYRDGRWCWMGGDYVWVSYEPWGWAPYHYGRWAFIGSLGWCWVPPAPRAVFWAPAYVGWVRTPDHVAWVPLAPGETYYGRGNHGPNSVNITKINVNNVVINKTYRNVNARNGVVATTRETFLTGRGEHLRLSENPFLAHRPNVGAPAIKPERRTFMPSLKEIPRSQRPPEHLTSVIPRGMEKPLSAERKLDRSVFRPAQPQQQMPVQRPGETGPAAGMRQRAERGSPPVAERVPAIERPPRPAQSVRPETRPMPARPAPPESTQKPAQPGVMPGAVQPASPGPLRTGPERKSAQPEVTPKATRPEPAPKPDVAPPLGRSERSPGPTRPEVTPTPPKTVPPTPGSPPPRETRPAVPASPPPAPPRPSIPEVRPVTPPSAPSAPARPPQAPPAPAPRENVRQPTPEAKPVAPPAPARQPSPEVKPITPPAPPRPSIPEVRPVAPPAPSPAPVRPSQPSPPPAPREQIRQPVPEVRPAAPPPPPPAVTRPPQAPPAPAPREQVHQPPPKENAPTPTEPGPPSKDAGSGGQRREGR